MYRTHTLGELRTSHTGQHVTLSGWIHRRRDHGGIIFIDLRDRYGLTQIVFDPEENPEVHQVAESLRPEWVITIEGVVRERGEGLQNPNMETGAIEVLVNGTKVLSQAQTPPFEIASEKGVREELRLQYRYLDLRHERLQKNLQMRADVVSFMRQFHNERGFIEVETPILIKGTPEGSREYLVPSRMHPGELYVLPQSPQQLKQLLMVGGIDRYYQIARCFRDEDLRGDRQPEFTQLDVEMSFVEQEDVLQTYEELFLSLTRELLPQKQIMSDPFPRLTYEEAMSRYGSDKPDLRFGLELTDVTELREGSGFGIFERVESLFVLRVPKEHGELSRKDIEDLTDLARQHGAGGLAWLRVGEESGPVAKNSTPDFQKAVIEKAGAGEGDMVFFGAGSFVTATEPLGAVRSALGERFSLKDPEVFAYCWVYDFPLFEQSDEGGIGAVHHPFTRPHPEDEQKIESDPLSCRAVAYDIVLNGYEIGGGSIRIHEHELQQKVFQILGMDEETIQARFGHMLEAFSYGVPPHGGIAPGVDRIVMLFCDEPNIREVMAFPKNQSAQDLMLGAPSPMPEEQLHELGIQLMEREED